MLCTHWKDSVCVKLQLAQVVCGADPANIDGKFEGPPLVSLDPDILGSLLSSGIHTRRQDLWDDIWTALSIAGVDVAQPPGIRTDAHDFVRDGLHMPRCPLPVPLFSSILPYDCSSLCWLIVIPQSCGMTILASQSCDLWGLMHCSTGTWLTCTNQAIVLIISGIQCWCSHACVGKALPTFTKEASALCTHLCFLIMDDFSMMFLACSVWPFPFDA